MTACTTWFNYFSNLCSGIVKSEYKKDWRYIWGLTPLVQDLVTAFKPTTIDSSKQLAYHFTEQYLRPSTTTQQKEQIRKEGRKRKYHEESKGNFKLLKSKSEPMNVYGANTNTPTLSKSYFDYCTKCNFHHVGNCMVCNNCKLKGHTFKFCRKTPTPTPTTKTLNIDAVKMRNYFKYNQLGHYKKDFPKLNNRGGKRRI